MTCPDCERHKLSASMWRNEAYKHAGTPLPWKPEELLREEYERGFIDGMQKQMQSSVDKAVNGMTRQWVGLTDEERRAVRDSVTYNPMAMTVAEWTQAVQHATEAKIKEKNNG